MNPIYKEIDKKIKQSLNIAILTHKFPDGDTLGSATAFYEILLINYSDKKVDIINYDPLAEKLSFLHNSEKIIKEFNSSKYDLCIFLDIGNIILTGFGEKNTLNCNFIINIDHHESNIGYGDINLVNSRQPSTASLLYNMFKSLGYKLNSNIATSLLTGIYTDTGAFIYSNVLPETFLIASELVELGGNIEVISSNFFLNNTYDFIKLLGIVLERLRVTQDGVAISYLKKEDISESGCKYEELDGIVWRLNMLDNKRYVIFIYEKGDIVKGSFRTTREDTDLTKIAGKYNGGGHKKACGLTLDGQIFVTNEGKPLVKLYSGEEIDFLNN